MSSGARPNIILILSDDLGYSDISPFGSEIRTPNLHTLSEKGLRYSQMYSFGRCCPSRGALLTGLYPHQSGIGHMNRNLGPREYQGYLRDDCVTIAEVLKSAGYRTMMSGKWHVGGNYMGRDTSAWPLGREGFPSPRQRGFDRFFGTLIGAGSYYHPHTLLENEEWLQVPDDGFYYTDAISDKAVEMIEEAHGLGEPFFQYVAYTAPHWPLHAPEEDIERYRGRYQNGGWDRLRMERHESLKATGVLAPVWSLSPRDSDAPAWDDAPNHEWEDLRMAVYAAQIDRMDQGIGKIRAALQRLDIEDNTLIIFLSDNGGCAEFMAEEGYVQTPTRTLPDGRLVYHGNTPGVEPGGPTSYMSYDLPWANASNAPFRLFKHYVHEGGVSSPCVVSYPAGIPAGGIVHSTCSFIDIMATCIDLAGATYPAEVDGQAITPLEGESIVPSFTDSGWQRERPVYWEHEGNRALRLGDWKLVCKFPNDWELYNLLEDRTELHDRAATEPERLKRMTKLYAEWADRCGVRPWEPSVLETRRWPTV
jgi:arylsulfatase